MVAQRNKDPGLTNWLPYPKPLGYREKFKRFRSKKNTDKVLALPCWLVETWISVSSPAKYGNFYKAFKFSSQLKSQIWEKLFPPPILRFTLNPLFSPGIVPLQKSLSSYFPFSLSVFSFHLSHSLTASIPTFVSLKKKKKNRNLQGFISLIGFSFLFGRSFQYLLLALPIWDSWPITWSPRWPMSLNPLPHCAFITTTICPN